MNVNTKFRNETETVSNVARDPTAKMFHTKRVIV